MFAYLVHVRVCLCLCAYVCVRVGMDDGCGKECMVSGKTDRVDNHYPTLTQRWRTSPTNDDKQVRNAAMVSCGRMYRTIAPRHGDDFPTSSPIPTWATVDPYTLSAAVPHTQQNLVKGQWVGSERYMDVVDPMNGEVFLKVPDTQPHELNDFIESARECPKSGLHNPLKNPERYVQYGELCHQAGHLLGHPDTLNFFAKLIARVMPKSYYQAWYETKVSADFLKNFGGDNPRFLAGGFSVSGDHTGQESRNYRWPYGPVALVAPFNFPLEIPCLQLMGALIMGNKPTVKVDSKVSLVMDQFLRLLTHCGMSPKDVDFINCDGPVMGQLIDQGPYRLTQFTGSSRTGELLAEQTHGKVRLEDAGFDWKIMGPDVLEEEFVAWTCDQDAYACTGQKCSAQSLLVVHKNWAQAGLYDKLAKLAKGRSLAKLTVGPVMTHTTEDMLSHIRRLLEIEGSKVLFGGKELSNHTIPKRYGALEPTAVFVPLKEFVKEEHFDICTKEIFGPFQVVTEYQDHELPLVLEACERISHHLTAAVVSNDPRFQNKVLGSTVNGTTYAGIRARTTGAPQNHWFGPAGDPRGAGIGTPEAIKLVWSCHREIIKDEGEVPSAWEPRTS